MLKVERTVKEVSVVTPGEVPEGVMGSAEPILLKNLVSHWPMVNAAKDSPAAVDSYIRQFDAGVTINAVYGDPGHNGRIFYNEDMSGFNFQTVQSKLGRVLEDIRAQSHEADPASVYVGSTPVDKAIPGFRSENDIQMDDINALVSIWLGNRSRIAAHFDQPDNIACCAAGRRRFILFPPQEIVHLYPGPIHFTPAGQIISMVDFENPDYDRHPLFRKALGNACVADLLPGDALYVPSMWWHHVEGLEILNILINYWWNVTPVWMDAPANVLDYALLALRDLPRQQRDAWRAIFDYYIFDFNKESNGHINEARRGALAPLDDITARRLRAQLLNNLNR